MPKYLLEAVLMEKIDTTALGGFWSGSGSFIRGDAYRGTYCHACQRHLAELRDK